jgi:sugar lactone lactonase YvrE
MDLTRRQVLTAAGATAASLAGSALLSGCGHHDTSSAQQSPLALTVAAESPWMANQVALTSDGTMFLGLPRFPGHETTPSVARRSSDGTVAPFPGNAWNEWAPGDSGRDSFVYVNSVHTFADDSVWCVDQGGLRPDASPKELSTPKPGAQKIVRLDARKGTVLDVLRFDDDILPTGAQMNDLRIHGTTVYVTDSGLGALIIHDTATGRTLRRLAGRAQMLGTQSPTPTPTTASPSAGGTANKHRTPKSDMIEVSADGSWLYWSTPDGPVRRIRTSVVRDTSLSDDEVAARVEHVADIPLCGGCALDTRGNLYLSDIDHHRILLLSPAGKQTVLASDAGLISPDGSFIDSDRRLYVPAPQTRLTELFGHAKDLTSKPFLIYSLRLPDTFDGIRLGDAVTGG